MHRTVSVCQVRFCAYVLKLIASTLLLLLVVVLLLCMPPMLRLRFTSGTTLSRSAKHINTVTEHKSSCSQDMVLACAQNC